MTSIVVELGKDRAFQDILQTPGNQIHTASSSEPSSGAQGQGGVLMNSVGSLWAVWDGDIEGQTLLKQPSLPQLGKRGSCGAGHRKTRHATYSPHC